MAVKNKWTVVSKKGKNFENFFISILARGMTDFPEKMGSLQLTGTAWMQAHGNRYFPFKALNKHIDKVLSLFKKDIDTVIAEYKFYQKILAGIENAAKDIPQKDFQDLNLVDYLDSWSYHFDRGLQYGYDYYFLNQPVADIILDALRRNNSKDIFGDFEILSQAKELSEIQKEKKDLLTIVQEIENKKWVLDSQEVDQVIIKHLEIYAALGMYFFRGQAWQKEDIVRRIKDWQAEDLTEEIDKLEKFAKADKLSQEMFKQYDFTDYEKKVVTLMKEMAYATNRYDEVHTYFIFKSNPLMRFVADKIDVTYDQLIELSFFEVMDLLKNNKKASQDLKDLSIEREKDSLLLAIKGKVTISVGKEAQQISLDEIGEEEISNDGELKGNCACQGKAKGRVVILESVKDLNKVQKGDIMVARATAPAFVPAMEKAAGIVTEMGGLLSHAAIVSREMNTPCIVGVDNVTTILKTGDIIEMDAKEGIVKIV